MEIKGLTDLILNLSKINAYTREGLRQGMLSFARSFLSRFTKEKLRGRPGVKSGTGLLARSFNYNVVEDAGKGLALIVWTANKYAATQEFGDDNRVPKSKQWLAFPAPGSPVFAGTAGVARQSAGSLKGTKGFFVGHKKETPDKPFIARIEGGKLVVYFLLRKRVKIPARLGLKETFVDHSKLFPAMAKDAIDTELSKHFKRI